MIQQVPRNGQRSDNAAREVCYASITCAELDANHYALEYLIDGALVRGQPCIVAGGKKTLKTSLIVDAGISLALGEHFLGQIRTTACTAAIMSGESGLATLQETARRIAAAKGFALSDVERLFWSTDLPRFGDALHAEALRNFLGELAVEVLFVDPAYLAMPGGDAGNLFIQGELLREFTKLCEELKVTLVLCHHTRKGVVDPFAPPELEDIAWAGFQEFARQWWLVGRRESYEPGTGEHRLWLNVGGSAGHSALWGLDVSEGVGHGERRWQVATHNAREVRQDARQRADDAKKERRSEQAEADKQAVVEALARLPEGDTTSGIRTASGVRTGRFGVALAALLRERRIVTVDIIKGNNRHYEGYKLADSDAQK